MVFNSSFWKRFTRAYKQGRLPGLLYARIHPWLSGIRYLVHSPASKSVSLHCPEYINPGQDDLEIVRRIFDSFKKMKEDQKQAPEHFSPSSLWQDQLDDSYDHLITGLQENDISKFHYFLANFGTWKKYHGVEHNTFMRSCMKSLIKRRYLQNDIFYRHLKTWKWFYNNRKPISSLSYPDYGNQVGAYIDGVFVGIGSFFNEIYGSLLSGIVNGTKRPVIADLGGGYGRLAYFTLRNLKEFAFIDFDLPETLCLAAYYMMKVYPDKKVLLYGEEEYSSKAHTKYDLIFMPSYEICKVGSSSVDLFLNKNSLGEMTKNSVNSYIDCIAKSTRYFFHMNHDIRPNIYSEDETGFLAHEYPVPVDKFNLLFRYPDMGHLFAKGWLDFNEDIFMYLYERRSQND